MTEKLDFDKIAELNARIDAAKKNDETATYYALEDELADFLFDCKDQLIALAERAEQLQAENAELRKVIADCNYEATEMRTWAGTGWHYHSRSARRIFDRTQAAMEASND